MNYLVTYELMDGLGLIVEQIADIDIDPNGDIGAQITAIVHKLVPHARITDYYADETDALELEMLSQYFV